MFSTPSLTLNSKITLERENLKEVIFTRKYFFVNSYSNQLKLSWVCKLEWSLTIDILISTMLSNISWLILAISPNRVSIVILAISSNMLSLSIVQFLRVLTLENSNKSKYWKFARKEKLSRNILNISYILLYDQQ